MKSKEQNLTIILLEKPNDFKELNSKLLFEVNVEIQEKIPSRNKYNKSAKAVNKIKDLGHLWLGYIRMLGHLQLSAHLPNFERL